MPNLNGDLHQLQVTNRISKKAPHTIGFVRASGTNTRPNSRRRDRALLTSHSLGRAYRLRALDHAMRRGFLRNRVRPGGCEGISIPNRLCCSSARSRRLAGDNHFQSPGNALSDEPNFSVTQQCARASSQIGDLIEAIEIPHCGLLRGIVVGDGISIAAAP
jgi:hypothetical protein